MVLKSRTKSSVSPRFCKQAACPSSAILLSFSSGETDGVESMDVISHLATCDFCCAELQLLKLYQPTEEDCRCVEIPLHVRCLAEAILSNMEPDAESFVGNGFERVLP